MMRKSTMAVAGCGLLLSALVAGPVQAAPIVPVGCTVAAPDTSRLDLTPDADGLPRYAGWLGGDRGKAFSDRVGQAMSTVVQAKRSVGKETIADRLRRGVIGTALDDNTQTVVVVTTPEFGKGAQLGAALATVRQTPDSIGLKTRTITGCYSAKALIEIDELLNAADWHPDAKKAAYGYSLDAATSTYQVSFDPAYPAAAAALQARLGRLGTVTLDKVSSSGRLDDGSAHFGGAGIRPHWSATNTCTSAFNVWRNSDWQPGSVSAAHCFGNGSTIYSGPKNYGHSWGVTQYPLYDIVGITKIGSEAYDNVIHVDPCCPSQRNVTGKHTTWAGDVVCLSGMVTKATCGVRVTDAYATVCYIGGICTPGVIRGVRNGEVIVRGGDSGGPVYSRTGTNGANALGMIIAMGDGGRVVYAEHGYHLENYLQVTIMTY